MFVQDHYYKKTKQIVNLYFNTSQHTFQRIIWKRCYKAFSNVIKISFITIQRDLNGYFLWISGFRSSLEIARIVMARLQVQYDKHFSELLIFSQLISRALRQKKQKQKQPSRGVLSKRCSENMLNFTGEHPCQNVISIKLRRVFSGKFTAYFQNTFY